MKGWLKVKFNICLPPNVEKLIQILQQSGYDAYIVGGCVRDSLLGLSPKDWDICTSATPPEIKKCLSAYHIIDTGLQHGTVTVVMDNEQYEVTTFRIDGAYSDCRRPDFVQFVRDIENDLARRDFTMNAMAYNPTSGLIDPFDGQEDLSEGRITCVGDADARFNEDALRIMRALRFASVYNFTISSETEEAIHRNVALLNNIAYERINTELCQLLCGKNSLNILLSFDDVIATIIPELCPCIGFNQNNPYHQFTIYDHIAHAVASYTGTDIVTKISLLLHDIGKPLNYTEDEKGGHFYGHGVSSKQLAEIVVKRLKFDNMSQKSIVELVLFHDSLIEPTPKTIRRWLNKIGENQLHRLLDIHIADALAHTPGMQQNRIDKCNQVRVLLNDIIQSEQCFSLKRLNINGDDLMAIGYTPGKYMGVVLNQLLQLVIDGECENERMALLQEACKRKSEQY